MPVLMIVHFSQFQDFEENWGIFHNTHPHNDQEISENSFGPNVPALDNLVSIYLELY